MQGLALPGKRYKGCTCNGLAYVSAGDSGARVVEAHIECVNRITAQPVGCDNLDVRIWCLFFAILCCYFGLHVPVQRVRNHMTL